MAPPIQFGLGLSLARAGGAALDADAAAYIAAVETAGATVSGGQKAAIDTFVKTGKSDGWYSSLKRLYLPIWGSAAANAICMVSRTSGTFNGTVTHGAGFVQGDGSTGYFDLGVTPNNSGMAHGNEMLFGCQLTDSGNYPGAIIASVSGLGNGPRLEFSVVSSFRVRARLNNFTQISLGITTRQRSVAVVNSPALNSRASYLLRGGVQMTKLANTTGETSTTDPNQNLFALVSNVNGTPDLFHGGQIAFFGCGSSLSSDAQIEAFSLNLQNCWQSLTGQTL
jgi:hypothetical protein